MPEAWEELERRSAFVPDANEIKFIEKLMWFQKSIVYFFVLYKNIKESKFKSYYVWQNVILFI